MATSLTRSNAVDTFSHCAAIAGLPAICGYSEEGSLDVLETVRAEDIAGRTYWLLGSEYDTLCQAE